MKKLILITALILSSLGYSQTPFPSGIRLTTASKSDTLSSNTRIPILQASSGNLMNKYISIDSISAYIDMDKMTETANSKILTAAERALIGSATQPSDLTPYITSTTAASTYEPIFSKNTAFNKNFGTTAGTVMEGWDKDYDDLINKPTIPPIIAHLEYDNTGKTVWNNGQGDLIQNNSFGRNALDSNTTGINNSAFGSNSSTNITTGSSNSSYGASALQNTVSGMGNTGIGVGALQNSNGNHNTGLGVSSLVYNTTGSNNIALGYVAGAFLTNGFTLNTISNNSIFIGNNTESLGDNQINQIIIGHGSEGYGSNTIRLGNSSITDTYIDGIIHGDGSGLTGVGGGYTDEEAQDAVGGILSSEFVYNDTTPSITIAANGIAYSKLDSGVQASLDLADTALQSADLANYVTLTGTENLENKTLTSPILITPSLGVATATSINGATITSGTLNGTVTGTNTGDQDLTKFTPVSLSNSSTIVLDNVGGKYYNASANSAKDYTVSISGTTVGAFSKTLINTTSEPTVNTVTTGKQTGATWVTGTNMYMVIYTENGTTIKYYFLKV